MIDRPIMHAKDTVSAALAECYVTIDGNRYCFMQAINLEAKVEKIKSEVPILGKPGRGNKAAGWKGPGSATFHYNTSLFRELLYRYKQTGADVYKRQPCIRSASASIRFPLSSRPILRPRSRAPLPARS